MKIYKLRHKVSGLFSTGTTEPKFNKKGKTWSGVGHIKSHLTMFKFGHCAKRYVNYIQETEIVEFDVVLTGGTVIPYE